MNAEILAVGTELLMGQIANTNAQYISGRLPEVGVNVYYHSVVGDNPKRLKDCLEIALKRSDAVIMTGGLGPTQDDLTKETVAETLGKKLVLHEESLKKIEEYFAKTNRPMAKNNIKQAYLPEGCIVISNNNGTAPGCIIESGGKVVIMLPGPPSEMKPMFEDTVIPYFLNKAKSMLVSKHIRMIGIGESAMEEKIMDLIQNQTNPTIAPYAKEGEVTLRITANCSSREEGEGLIAPVVDEIRKRLGNTIYSLEDKPLYAVVGEMLIEKNITIALAESCTGGLIAEMLTNVPGISRVFDRGIVSYSNQSKVECLGVNPETIQRFGAVSRETAVEMARGIKERSGTDIGLSVTGIAGPGGGTPQKPVGLVYIALAYGDQVECRELRLMGNRAKIRNITALNALDMIRLHIMNQ
ncbi:competence/damage-inducible protein A [Clostridium thermosuccinogenes]|jgi:nicotinamide-nucleotide amidase|uniref:Putative competence-damage inducible protein n=1 Tax=Clostridium thermosuccinogenes TaxID=84032 RepID=A0A2K2F6I9_9CLOT|nr:competence/damage-inducible protein A [Pseudoclostridium thermosuccinogenes]AUS96444.1 competence/damage-inducible protein A [Pseudoclostridium thermosuccinogenes]PNT94392.1 competence/damage-inducible protein A [Pseudoclostridium thermosuccinogenes]PNT97784.1 competence/damage-inducible protein A [Pseudoclostridium thermosuccinogenes]PNT99774.1 competence/damage-inducible protein A [Pseudoclostridium thermosuccinogenes]